MPFVSTSRLRVHYEEAGAGPELFVFVHGNFASWRWWKPILEKLPPGWHGVAPDLRGCGETSADADGARSAYAIPELAGDLAGFVDALGYGAFHLVGHSLGSAVALQFALQHEARVRSLTLVAPAPPTGLSALREGTSTAARFLRRIDPDHRPSLAALQSSYGMHRALGTNRWILRRALAEMMPSAALDGVAAEALLSDASRLSSEAVVGFLEALHRWNVEAELARLRVPTVILWGAKDTLIPRAGLEKMAQLLPAAELVVWPDTGHSPQLERPDAFVDLLVSSRRGLLARRLRMLLGRAKRWYGAAL
jgi:branched-chain amino acid transport system permease protein